MMPSNHDDRTRPMMRRCLAAGILALASGGLPAAELRAGILGLDTSPCITYSKLLDPAASDPVSGARFVASLEGRQPGRGEKRLPGRRFRDRNEGPIRRRHLCHDRRGDAPGGCGHDSERRRTHPLGQATKGFPFKKPVFVDKPAAGTLRDMIALFQLAREQDVPCFSAWSLRFGPHLDRVKSTPIGELPGVFAWGRAQTVPHRPDLLGYGIPTVEMLSAVIGTGCESVVRTHTGDTDVITGRWAGGKEATVHGLRNAKGAGWGLQALGTTGMATSPRGQESASELREIIKFFRTKVAPVPAAETIEVLAFAEAADESKRRGGPPVPIKEFIALNQPGRVVR